MPFIRKGLCATDQRTCARWQQEGRPIKWIASRLHTTENVVKKFTTDTLEAQAKKTKLRELKVAKQVKDTRATAAALAGASREILNQIPSRLEDGDEFE